MSGKLYLIAESVISRIGLRPPLHPLFACRAADLLFAPKTLPNAAAELRAGLIVFYDERNGRWREAVADIVCGTLLRNNGLPDDRYGRAALANLLGLPTRGESAEFEPVSAESASGSSIYRQ